jgi:hypothetical protein
MREFIKKHGTMILGTLCGMDRVRFRGSIRLLCSARGLTSVLTQQKVRLTEFYQFCESLTATLKGSVEQIAQSAGRSIRYIASSLLSKEDLVQELLRREGISEGLVCVLSCVEPCRTYQIRRDQRRQRIDFMPSLRKCLHWYLYFVDAVFGLCHVRIQSWLPFTAHICINGREWLCRGLDAAGIPFRRRDNCLVDVADFTAAQKLLDQQPRIDWTTALDDLLYRACPVLETLPYGDESLRYYWSAAETEWATDILFRSPEQLAELYPGLLHHAMTTFSSPDVMRFLGRRCPQVSGNFQGEVVSDLKSRPEGVRIKHRLNANSIKMYDKQGSVLRVETTINDPHDMRTYRASERDPDGEKSWRVLRKGVVDLPRRGEISQAANGRYLSALAAVDIETPLGKIADDVARPILTDKRRVRGLNPLTGEDARLAAILLHGEFSINGFRNRDIRERLYPGEHTPTEKRRQSGKITRLLTLFRHHGLIRKIKGTHRYHLTSAGRRTLPAFTTARSTSIDRLNQIAA